jgi:hypothetical protein
VNAEFFDQVSDHDPSLILLTADLDLQQSPMPIVVTSGTPILSWSRVIWAASYEIQLDDSSDFDSPITYTTSGTSLTLPAPGLPNGTYYWRVRGQALASLGGEFGAFSPVSAFTVEAE